MAADSSSPFVVVPQTGPWDRDDPLSLLRQRLIVVALVFTAAPAIYAGRAIYMMSHGMHAPGAGRLDLLLLVCAFALTLSLLLTLLFCRRLSLTSLRLIELLGFGHALALFHWWLFEQMQAGWLDESGDRVAANATILARFWVLPVFGSIMAYGTLIPNTWRRCALVIGCIVCCPLLTVLAAALLGSNYASGTLAIVMLEMSFWMAIGAGLAIFGAHRMEVLRKRVAEARTLGQYRLQQKLGSGGMGEVFLAEHVLLRRPCAIKLIRPDRAGDPKNLVRFLQEVRVTATLSHPNTIQVYDYGHAADGTFYYVMEYLPGVTLDQLVGEYGRVPPARAVHFLRQICDALQEAHSIGLIHRDIKPSNVIICQRGGRFDTVKLLDFGLAMPLRYLADDDTLSQDDVIVGTPAYMSPEQASGHDHLDVRSDVYSVGAVAYFLLTGQPPFANRSAVGTIAGHLYETPAPVRQHQSDVAPKLDELVLRCLAKRPADRFPDVAALSCALTGCSSASAWNDGLAAEWWANRAVCQAAAAQPSGALRSSSSDETLTAAG